MKIAYVIPSLAIWGGIERIVTDKANWLAARGHHVLIVTTGQGTHRPPYPLDSRIVCHDLGICFHHQYRYQGLRRLVDAVGRQHRFRQRLQALLRAEQPDIIVGTAAHYAGTLASIKGKAALVVESHSICERLVDTGRMRLLRRWLKLWQLRRADMLVALTEGDAAVWRRHLSHVAVIPNFTHAPTLPPAATPRREKRVIFVGRLDTQKQPDHLLQAWAIVSKQFPDWRLTIYGEGDMQPAIARQVATFRGSVELMAPTPHIGQAYAEAALLVLPSLFEPFGLVVVEAMSSALPVVAYDCHYGPRDIITHGTDGLLVTPCTPDALAHGMARLMADETMRHSIGMNAQLTAQRYTAERVMPLWESLFLQLCPC